MGVVVFSFGSNDLFVLCVLCYLHDCFIFYCSFEALIIWYFVFVRRNESQRQSVEINVCFRLPEEFFLFGFVSFFPFAIFYDYASFVFFCNSRSFFVFSRLCRFVLISICVYADLIFRSSRYFNCVCGACRLAIHVWDLRPAGWCRAYVATMCASDVDLCGGGSLTHARARRTDLRR